MKESEAKEKWCPMARVVCNPNGPAYNRLEGGEPSIGANCLGSDCMMWMGGEIWSSDENKYIEDGYCGLTR